MATLKSGSKGTAVKKLQVQLNKRGKPSPKLDEDGIFGAGTKAAVVLFQKKNGLTPDGIVGPKTADALDGKTTSPAASPAPSPAAAPGKKGKVAGPTSGVAATLIDALEAVADHYGVTITVTSGKRNPADQARAMWNNWKSNLKEGALYTALQKDKKTLESLRKAYDGGDKKTFNAEIKRIAPKLSRHLSGQAVDVKKNTNAKAVKAMASMFHHIAEKTCHHFDTKRKPGAINDALKAKWPK